MAGIYPIPTLRSSELLAQTRLVNQLLYDQRELLRLQSQIATGRRLTVASDDAAAATRGMAIQRLLELKSQAKVNLNMSQSYLDATDTAISGVSDLLLQVRATAMGAIGTPATDADRQVAAEAVQHAIGQLFSIGNKEFRGRYLFGGSRSTIAPYEEIGDLIRYRGNDQNLRSYTDIDLLTATNAPGSDVFGAYSPQVLGSVDLNPIVTAGTRLADLHGGTGVTLGRIEISDGTTSSVIDLAGAETIGDVIDLIEANPPAGRTITASVTASGLVIAIDPLAGTALTIREVSGGQTAADLGILANVSAGNGPIVGSDLDPRLTLTTALADIVGVDVTSGLQIRNAGQTYTIDLSSAVTIEDILNAINGSDAQALAEINEAGTGLNLRSRLAGTDFAVGENGGQTATQLGLRSLTEETLLADLNFGEGVRGHDGDDFIIRRSDGSTFAIDVAGAATLGDVIDLINNHASNQNLATQITARLAAFGNGLALVEANPLAGGSLQVEEIFGSHAARDLGLVPLGATSRLSDPPATVGTSQVLTGRDVNPLEVSGVFNSLLRLHKALLANDLPEINRSIGLLDLDYEQINFARGEVGFRGQALESLKARLEDEDVQLQSALSQEIDTDMASAISTLTARQAALEATLRLTANLHQLTLFNFL